MPAITQPYVWKLNDIATPALMNANPAGFVTAINNIDNGNIGAAGLFASNLKPLTTVQATFGGVLPYVFPAGATSSTTFTALGGTTGGYLLTTATGFGFTGGTGAPTHSAPNGTIWVRFDGPSGAVLYLNQSGASSSGTTWIAINPSVNPYATQSRAQIAYTTTGSETNGSPGTIGTTTLTLPSSSPGTNGNWAVDVHAYFTIEGTAPNGFQWGIGSTTAGATPFPLYGNTTNQTHTITGGNCISDITGVTGTSGQGALIQVHYNAIYANSATPTFNALYGAATQANVKFNGYIQTIAIPN